MGEGQERRGERAREVGRLTLWVVLKDMDPAVRVNGHDIQIRSIG